MSAKAELKKENVEIEKPDGPNDNIVPLVAEDHLFEKFANVTRDIAERAYAFFRDRGGEFGREIDDWFKAEHELLRPVPVEITETDDKIVLTAAVPGFKPEEIEISVKDDVLTMNGISELNFEEENSRTVLREWSSNRFCRRLTLPAKVDAEGVKAELLNGMLKLTMPKAPPREPQEIEVKAA